MPGFKLNSRPSFCVPAASSGATGFASALPDRRLARRYSNDFSSGQKSSLISQMNSLHCNDRDTVRINTTAICTRSTDPARDQKRPLEMNVNFLEFCSPSTASTLCNSRVRLHFEPRKTNGFCTRFVGPLTSAQFDLHAAQQLATRRPTTARAKFEHNAASASRPNARISESRTTASSPTTRNSASAARTTTDPTDRSRERD